VKNKFLSLIGMMFLILPVISANDFRIELEPHYYSGSNEIFVYDNHTPFTGVSFDIYGKNLDNYWRILNLTIIGSSSQLEGMFSNDSQDLRIAQKKLLWQSDIISIERFSDENTTNIWVDVIGICESDLREIHDEANFTLNIYTKADNNSFWIGLGNKIWEGNPTGGLGVLILLVFGGFFIFWYFKGSDKFERWRDNRETKRAEVRQQEEGWK